MTRKTRRKLKYAQSRLNNFTRIMERHNTAHAKILLLENNASLIGYYDPWKNAFFSGSGFIHSKEAVARLEETIKKWQVKVRKLQGRIDDHELHRQESILRKKNKERGE